MFHVSGRNRSVNSTLSYPVLYYRYLSVLISMLARAEKVIKQLDPFLRGCPPNDGHTMEFLSGESREIAYWFRDAFGLFLA